MKKNIPALLIALGIVVLGWFIYSALNNLAYRDRQVQVRGLMESAVSTGRRVTEGQEERVGKGESKLSPVILT